MNVEWDEDKRRTNLTKHGLDLADAAEVLDGPVLRTIDDRQDYGEDRWIGLGWLRGRIVVLVYSEPLSTPDSRYLHAKRFKP